MNGESNREIAGQEGIGRDTVGRILSQQEIALKIAQYRASLLDLAPQAIKVYGKALASEDLHLATATATKLMEGMHVLSDGGIEDLFALANKASPEVEDKERRTRIIAQIIESSLEKSRIFNQPLTPGMADVKEQLDRRLKEPAGD